MNERMIPAELIDAIWDSELGYAYNPETGQCWYIRQASLTNYDSQKGKDISRTLKVADKYKTFTHVIWKIMTGNWPRVGYFIDHKDGQVTNSKWNNLREATPSQNGANRKSFGRLLDGIDDLAMGVCLDRRNGRYQVIVAGKYYGKYLTKEEANTVAIAKRKELFGEFIRDEQCEL